MLRKIFIWFRIIKPTKLELLSNINNWFLHADWSFSLEPDYVRKPRQFWKNKKVDDYMINAIHLGTPIPKEEVVKQFIIDYNNQRLLRNRVSIQQTNKL